jgi:hypothetical protein
MKGGFKENPKSTLTAYNVSVLRLRSEARDKTLGLIRFNASSKKMLQSSMILFVYFY